MTEYQIVPIINNDSLIRDVSVQFADLVDDMSAEVIRTFFNERRWTLWQINYGDKTKPVHFATAITEKGLLIPALVGEGRGDWLSIIEDWSNAFAKMNGAPMVYFYGRPGWRKDATTRGWGVGRTVYTREVS